MTRGALTARARLVVQPAQGRQRIRWSQAWPVVIRPTADDQVHLVHGAGGPLGGDDLALEVVVAAGAAVRVRSAAATLVQPGAGAAASWTVTAEVGAGGRLDWTPEATVVCDGAELVSRLRVGLAVGATAVLREVLVLGRYGERGGRCRSEVLVDVAGVALLAHTAVVDGADEALRGPAGTAGARAVGTLVLAGAAGAPAPPTATGEEPGVRWAWSALEGPGHLLTAVGDPGRVGVLLDAQEALLRAVAPTPATA